MYIHIFFQLEAAIEEKKRELANVTAELQTAQEKNTELSVEIQKERQVNAELRVVFFVEILRVRIQHRAFFWYYF